MKTSMTRSSGHGPPGVARGHRILLGHGAGGLLSHELIRDVVAPHFMHEELRVLDDAACVPFASDRLVISTDGFVVDPPFFPAGTSASWRLPAR